MPDGRLRLTDAGIETVLMTDYGFDLPDFAAFPLLDSVSGRAALTSYARPFLELAGEHGVGFVLETPTWRANEAWGPELGYDDTRLWRVSFDAVEWARDLVEETGHDDVVVSGCVGPRDEVFDPRDAMTAIEAWEFHGSQVGSLARAGVDVVTSFTFAHAAEGVGFAMAAQGSEVPAVVGFTVETDGRLASGETLAEAIAAVDDATAGYPQWFMVNCAHPDHIRAGLDDGAWVARIGAVRANASRLSHAEIDALPTPDAGDPVELGGDLLALRDVLPGLGVVGGCCGTDLRHVREMAARLLA